MRENSRGKLPVLDERLGAIAALVRGGMPCVDVGCDHGYLIAYLAASGKIPRGIACDINPMPLQRAQKTLRAYGVENVQTRLTDGLRQIEPQDAGEIIIAGMGGELIAQILEDCPWAKSPRHYLLQPMTRDSALREYLVKNGFAIQRECAAVSGKFHYTIMSVEYTGVIDAHPGELFLQVGLLPQEKTPAAKAFLLHRAAVLSQIGQNQLNAARQNGQGRHLLELSRQIAALAEAMEIREP